MHKDDSCAMDFGFKIFLCKEGNPQDLMSRVLNMRSMNCDFFAQERRADK